MIKLILGAIAIVGATSGYSQSFDTSKKQIYSIHKENPVTFYCGCSYSGKKTNLKSCGYTVRKNKARAKITEIEHIMPAQRMGEGRLCWNTGGRLECSSNDDFFKLMYTDLHNLVPAIGEVNADRLNYDFGFIMGEPRKYGACNMEVDTKNRLAEPPENRFGDIARTYLYMSDRYGIELSATERGNFEKWNEMDPPDAWEIKRNQKIQAIQGNSNCYVSGGSSCKIEQLKDTNSGMKLKKSVIPASTPSFSQPFKLNESRGFSCGTKKYCKQMSSCDEAKFYLNQCGLGKLDRDGDGTPCESLCR